jgi:hypothetical protein
MNSTMRTLLFPAFALASLVISAQDLPQPSPMGKVEQVVGLTTVQVEYARPSMKGRKIFGELVPFGKVWRTGANLNTTIEFNGPVVIEGNKLAGGKYSLFTIPGEGTWTIILNKNTGLWGEGDRKEEEDVLQVKVPVRKGETMETLTILFDKVNDDRAEVQIRWENIIVPINIHADATDQAMANIKEALAKPDADFRAYHGSARFLLDRGMMLEEALKYAQKSVELDKKFWNLHTLALLQAKNGRIEEAISTAQESLKMAEEAKYDAYIKMNREKIAEWQGAKPAPAGKATGKR